LWTLHHKAQLITARWTAGGLRHLDTGEQCALCREIRKRGKEWIARKRKVFCRFCLPHWWGGVGSRADLRKVWREGGGDGWMEPGDEVAGRRKQERGTGPQISLDSKNRCHHWGEMWLLAPCHGQEANQDIIDYTVGFLFNVRTAYIHIRVEVFHKKVVPADKSSMDRCFTPLLLSLQTGFMVVEYECETGTTEEKLETRT
jgi:hypothetical protein